MTAKTVVIGGAGFIGRSLTRQLLAAGQEVWVSSRSVSALRSDHPRLHYVAGSVTDPEGVRQLVEGADTVYDLALMGGRNWEEVEREVVGGAMNVAQACVEKKVRRLIYTSSIAALYLGARGMVKDSDPNDCDHPGRGLYAKGKGVAERRLLEFGRSRGLEVVIVRPGVVVGADGPLTHYALGDCLADLHILGWGAGKNPLPFVLVEDVASAMVLAGKAPQAVGRCYNLVGDVRISAAEFVAILRQRSLRHFTFHPRSIYQIQGKELLFWIVKKLMGRKDPVLEPFRDLQGLTFATQFDCSEGKAELGWKPEADRERFLREAVDVLLPAIADGDVRLESR